MGKEEEERRKARDEERKTTVRAAEERSNEGRRDNDGTNGGMKLKAVEISMEETNKKEEGPKWDQT